MPDTADDTPAGQPAAPPADPTAPPWTTWHYGLVARWWAEFAEAQPDELAYLRAAIERYGHPALDLGCGTGRLLLPLATEGFDVDGADVSADMIGLAEAAARRAGCAVTLAVQPMHELGMPRRYRTIYMVGTLGIGGDRDRDREALLRCHRHLEPGGVLLLNHELPYAGLDERRWARWLPGRRQDLPQPWPADGERQRTANGDGIELVTRTTAFDPLAQRATYEMRARLWRHGQLADEQIAELSESLYFAQEIVQLLRETGFADVRLEAGYSGQPASADDAIVMFVARRD